MTVILYIGKNFSFTFFFSFQSYFAGGGWGTFIFIWFPYHIAYCPAELGYKNNFISVIFYYMKQSFFFPVSEVYPFYVPPAFSIEIKLTTPSNILWLGENCLAENRFVIALVGCVSVTAIKFRFRYGVSALTSFFYKHASRSQLWRKRAVHVIISFYVKGNAVEWYIF